MKPILFNTEMVRAILEGRKTVTRRCAFPNKDLRQFRESEWWFRGRVYPNWLSAMNGVQGVMSLCKYKPGDFLYVRETWVKSEDTFLYKADDGAVSAWGWKPSIHMPKEAARIFLRVTNVRAERLQDIDEDGAKAEGAQPLAFSTDGEDVPDEKRVWQEVGKALWDFIRIWDSTIKPTDRDKYGWAANPWVWVIEFERCEKPEEGI